MRAVRMKRLYGNNFAGDVCGFEEEVAAKLIADGFAEPYQPPGSAEPSRVLDLPPEPELLGLRDDQPQESQKAPEKPPVHKMETGRRRK